MKTIKLYTFILICGWWMIACHSHKTGNAAENEKIENTAFSMEELQARAAVDSNFRHSKMYSSYMEKAGIENSKKIAQLKDSGKLLLEFGKALKNLRESTDKLKRNPALSKNEQFITLIKLKTDKVREYQQMLKKAPLKPSEKVQFDHLCHL